MTIEEIETVVARCAQLRSPTFGADDRSPGKIGRLENYMLACAHARGDLEGAWRYAARAVLKLTEEWELLESLAPHRTERARNVERRMVRPDLFGALTDARQLKVEVERQIARLIYDEKTVSRAYTFITGQQ